MIQGGGNKWLVCVVMVCWDAAGCWLLAVGDFFDVLDLVSVGVWSFWLFVGTVCVPVTTLRTARGTFLDV